MKEKYNILFGVTNNSIFDVYGADGIMGLARTYNNYLLSPLLALKENTIIKCISLVLNITIKEGFNILCRKSTLWFW